MSATNVSFYNVNSSVNNNETIFADTPMKVINGTVRFNIRTFAVADTTFNNWTNVTVWFNRSATFASFNSNANYTGQVFFNVSVDTTTLADGNYSVNITANGPIDHIYSNYTFYNLTPFPTNPARNSSLFIIDNNAPYIAYASLALVDGTVRSNTTFTVRFDVTDSNGIDQDVHIRFGNTTFMNDTVYPRGTRAVDFYNLGDSNYTYNITVNDSVGQRRVNTSRSISIDTTKAVITITGGTNDVATLGAKATVTCTIVEVNPSNVTVTRTGASGNFCTGTSSCSADYTPDSYDSPTFTCTVRDKGGNEQTKTYKFTRIDPPTSGATTGGGAGGGASSTTSLGTVPAETSTTTSVSTQEVREVTFTTTKKVENAKVSVSTSSTKPASITTPPEGTTYSYFDVTTVGFTNADLKRASIKFAVLTKWLTDNGFTKDDITLYVFRDNAWKALKTTPAGGDETSEFFIAETEGFSTFAIVAMKKTAEAPAAPAPTETKPEAAAAAEEAAMQKAKSRNILWIVALLVVIALIVVFFAVKKRNR